ncbi:organic hydroperoxide resistance protein [Sandarakinorhabdus oryzae]|uniref:organic hydroperoxide resistance protein n=1 Tax=Sandarakinorhabdus oryzae TaxID=2675220 RepID=UPI0012E1053F|nr:organic hydroperoxide resistance protein [Sandarakinorhabdus oryzae]
MTPLYTAEATATGGRHGHAETSDGVISVNLAIPKAMGGPGGDGMTNPEQLFATGYAACFGSAVEYVARLEKAPLSAVTIHSKVHIGAKPGGGFQLAVELAAKLDGVDRAQAEALVARAHQVCPYSNATRGNIDVSISVLD